ncbi:Imh1 protein [Pichia kluyveri]|uniref:Imh1 protein n=1 Tax=Pichia kluyveri TaxID=36015 RepID=A0AAV5R0F6_PICKL|nr:Imh1 protein [Pichia kluyveri]
MFSKISQIGKTFADEINRINDEVNNPSNGQQSQLVDPASAKKVLDTKTPDVSELETPENMKKDVVTENVSTTASDDNTSNQSDVSSKLDDSKLKNNNNEGENKLKPNTDDKQQSEQVVPGTQIKFSSLPPEIRSRLVKYVKYENKYPSLYNAYKTEKKKSSLIKAFENMLQEQTPCSSIGELDGVRDYLRSLTSKSDMLTSELANITKEKKSAEEKAATLDKKVKELQQALTTGRAEDSNEIKNLKEQLRSLNEEKSKLQEIQSQYESSKLENKALLDKIEQLENEKVESKVDSKMEEENTTLKFENEQLKKQLDELLEEKNSINEKLESLTVSSKSNASSSEKKNQELNSKVADLEKSLESSKKLNDLFKEKLEKMWQEKEEKEKTSEKEQPSNNSTNLSKSAKKRKNKKQNQKQNKPDSDEPVNKKTTEIIPVEEKLVTPKSSDSKNEIELIEIKHQLSELESKYSEEEKKVGELTKTLTAKSNEIEDLKDMLRDVGDSLVESQKVNKDTTDLSKELTKVKNELESKKTELEMLRLQNSTALSDYEKTKLSLTKRIDEYSAQLNDLQTKYDRLVSTNSIMNRKYEESTIKINDFEKLLNRYKTSEQKYQSQIKSLSEEKNKLSSDLQSLQKSSTDNISKAKEYENIKNQLSRKQTSLVEAENRIKFLEEEKNKINDLMIELKVQNKELISKEKSFLETKKNLTDANLKLKSELTDSSLRINKLSLDNTRLSKDLEEYKDKYNEVKHVKTSSNDQVELFKKRVEELSMRNKEYENKIDIIQEELTQSRNMLQERIREMSTMRKLLVDNEETQNNDRKELKLKIDKLLEDKEISDNEYMMTIKNKQRELDELKRKVNDLANALEQSETMNKKLKEQVIKLDSNANSNDNAGHTLERQLSDNQISEYNSKMIESLRESLKRTENRVKEFEEVNEKLRISNQESSDKLIRLNKKYKLLSQQYKRKFSEGGSAGSNTPSRNGSFLFNTSGGSGRHDSISVAPDEVETLLHPDVVNNVTNNSKEEEDLKEKSIYIKNVLLGYLEHKEQRQMLLPVIKMLLYMTDEDGKKLDSLLSNK